MQNPNEVKRTGPGLKLIFDHTPDREAHAREAVQKVMRRNQIDLPLIPSVSEAHFPRRCMFCGKRVWTVAGEPPVCTARKCRKALERDELEELAAFN